MKRIIFGFFCLILFAPLTTAQSLESLTGHEHAAALRRGEKPLMTQFRNPLPRLLPQNEVLAKFIMDTHQELSPNVMVETLNLYPKPQGANNVLSAEEKIALYNSVLAISSLTGLEYFSASRGGMRTLYEISTVINDPVERIPVPDPFFSQLQEEISLYARQKDLTFGNNIYQFDFYTADGAIFFIQQNLTPLSLGIFPAIGRNRLRSAVAIMDAGEYLLIYVASMANVVSLPGMNERVGTSFANRAEAIFNWFSAQADGVFK